MAHYALLNSNNIVVRVISGKDENTDGIDWEQYYGDMFDMKCVRTSYNANIRGKFAGIGDYYDEVYNIFRSQTFNNTGTE